MMNFYHRTPLSLICILTTLLLFSACHAAPQIPADTEPGTDTAVAAAQEFTVDIEEYRRRAMELCEDNPNRPGYVTLTLDDNHRLAAVRIEFPAIGQDGKIHGTTDVEFPFDGRKPVVFPYVTGPYVTETNDYEQRKNLDAIRILKGIYGEYMLYEDGTLEYIGGIATEQLHRHDRIDRDKFGVDILRETYGIDITKITNAVVTAEYRK